MTPPPPHHHHPYFLSLKRFNVLLSHLILAANAVPKTGIDVSKMWCSMSEFARRCRLHPPSPEEAPGTSRWGVNHRDAHVYLQLSGINIQFAMKKIDQLYFNLVSSFLKYRMHFTCRTRHLANASGQMGNFTPLGLRKIEFYG